MNFAIIGCGFIANKHAQAIQNIEGAKLIAVCDRVSDLMQPYVMKYGAKPFTDIDEMLNERDIDIVCICTPSGTHALIAETVAKSKKHIILEKPIAMTIEETNQIILSSSENKVKLAVVHPNRFRSAAMKLKEILDRNLLGKISHALCLVNWNRGQEYYDQAAWRGTKKYDGGVLMNQAIHNLDLLLWYLGKPVEVFSMEATRIRNIETEDVSTGVIRFESGALATVQASTTVYSRNFEESITIFGEKGTVKIGGSNAIYFEHMDIEDVEEKTLEKWMSTIRMDPVGASGHEKILKDMIEAINENREPFISGEDGKEALKLVLAFYESAEIKQLVSIN